MAVLASPSCVQNFVQGHHDITKLRSQLSTHNSSARSPRRHTRGLHDASSPASAVSTPSQRSSLIHYPQKEQLSHCLEQYQTLAREGLDSNSAKEAAFWCCLGLGAVACSQSSLAQQAPFSAESRTGSTHSLDTVSDSGFAPSFDSGGRHCLSVDDPDVRNSITNLVGGLAGVFASDLLGTASGPHVLSLPDLGPDFTPVLARFGLVQDQPVENVLALAAKISAQLLSTLQSDCGAPGSTLDYWVLCLKFVISSSEGNVSASNELRSHLVNRHPPHCLAEPARSYITNQGGALGLTPFPTLDSGPKSPYMATRFHHRTRSRAASLMSHTSLRSFSSVRSLGGLSAKSAATMSLSHDFRAGETPSPSGSFIIGSSTTALRTLDMVAENLQVRPRRREPLSPENGSITVPNSPLKRTTLPRSSSNGSNGKGKGKENASQLPREGLRPGTANLSVRTGTRFAVTSPPTPSGLGRSTLPLPKLDPVLAALEKGSKFKSKSVCLNCRKKGDNYPCCPRCGEAWCSRECRVEANKGGKHVCKRAVSIG
ncbi:unnamed protein product [Rhizoctonia solani]|uniref:HIT-type domain-containing protein n=2 Tax=Rhizoctonia solani TaxID=456999 RepID=A0A8H3DE67_9AGAM|nr:hypothetical protein RSOL_095760 [Rhizoctonia solani AG-3 Rhs1AP]CAE6521838.1 unnamed protein product [Rhizoctonia solani]